MRGKTFYLVESHDCDKPNKKPDGKESPTNGHVINRLPSDLAAAGALNSTNRSYIPPLQSMPLRVEAGSSNLFDVNTAVECMDKDQSGALRMLPGIGNLVKYYLSVETLVIRFVYTGGPI